ncbi:MAG: hypothetical protein JOZ69_09245 [Myxococcales bacterium]|nr:hypothetical protein [Myxococcales bacterium]
MSLSRQDMLELMALADGELDGEAKDRAESLVARSPEARQVVLAMRASVVRTWLGEGLTEERARGADGIADAVMGRLGVTEAAPAGVVRRIGPAPSVRAARLGPRAAAAGVFLAMAAAALVYVTSSANHRGLAPVASVLAPSGEQGGGPERAPSAGQAALASQGVVVDEIDSPSRDVSIFQIPGAASASANASSVVVWIEDDQGAR